MEEFTPDPDANRLFEAAEAVLVMRAHSVGPAGRPAPRDPLTPSDGTHFSPGELHDATRFLERLGFLTPTSRPNRPGRFSR